MRFVCESCRAQYMINDEKVGPKGVKVRCRKCGYVILVKKDGAPKEASAPGPVAQSNDPDDALATQVLQTPLKDGDGAADLTNPGEDAKTGSMATPASNGAPTQMELPASTPAEKEAQARKQEARRAAEMSVKKEASLLGADEDEIGAVFDSVLSGAPGKPGESLGGEQNGEDDRQSTRVIDANVVKQLAEASADSDKEKAKEAATKAEDVPTTDWYVAINEKQTGPLALEQVKKHWDAGEIGPDSLCWRSGMGDWVPLSEVRALANVLSPKPPKPIVVAAPAVSNAPAVMSVPVQSAFSSGGMVQTMQSEMQVPIAAAPSSNIADAESTGTWRPSAASALASLVKDEMEALSKPPPKKAEPLPPAEEPSPMRGLLDLPMQDGPGEQSRSPVAPAAPVVHREPTQPEARPLPRPAPVNPYMANPGATFSAPAVSSYRPQSNRNLILGLSIGGGVVVLILLLVVVYLVAKQGNPQQVVVQPQGTVVQPPVAVAQPPVAVAPPAVPAPTTAAPAPTTAAPAPTALPAPAPTTAAPPTAVAAAPAPAAAVPAPKIEAPPPPRHIGGTAPKHAVAEPPPPKEEKKVAVKEEKAAAAPASSDDESFEDAFGTGKKATKKGPKAAAPSEDDSPSPKKGGGGYIPPPPGGGDVKEKLEQSDIYEVVLSQKSKLAACADGQHSKEPGVSGKLVMKWQIQTSGRTTNVTVVTDEYKSTYMASCVGGVIKGLSFPKHKQQGEPVQFPFKF